MSMRVLDDAEVETIVMQIIKGMEGPIRAALQEATAQEFEAAVAKVMLVLGVVCMESVKKQ